MSAATALQAAAVARLRATPALAGTGIVDAPPVRATLPYLLLDEPVVTDWSTKSWAGREAKLTLSIQDDAQGGGERPVRLRALAAAAEAALLGLAGDVGEGWRLASTAPLRSRLVRTGDRWVAGIEIRCRLWQPVGDE